MKKRKNQKVSKCFGGKEVFLSSQMCGGEVAERSGGSEDFAYFTHKVPSVMIGLAAGEPQKGYRYPLHHAKANFDEEVLWRGSVAFTATALQWEDDFLNLY